MSTEQTQTDGPAGTIEEVRADGDFEAAARTVPGYDHPSVFVENTDPRTVGADSSLDDLNVAQLREQADALGLDVPARARKAELVEAIEAHQAQTGEDTRTLDELSDDELVAEARALGVADPETLDREELIDAIEDEQDAAQ